MPDSTENRKIMAARQRRMAIQMSRAGESMEAIAARLGVTRGAARKMVTREAREFADHTQTDDRRMVHVEALMELWRTLYAPAVAGDLENVDRFLKVEERLSRLLALDLADLYASGAADRPDGAVPGPNEAIPTSLSAEPNGDANGDGDHFERRFIRTTP